MCGFSDLLLELDWMGCITVNGPGTGYLSGDCVYIRLGPEYVRDTGRGIYGVGAGIYIRQEMGYLSDWGRNI